MFPSSLGFSFLDSWYFHDPRPVASLNRFLLQPPFTNLLPFHHLHPFFSVCRRAISTRPRPEPPSAAVPLNLLILEALNDFPRPGRPILLTGSQIGRAHV